MLVLSWFYAFGFRILLGKMLVLCFLVSLTSKHLIAAAKKVETLMFFAPRATGHLHPAQRLCQVPLVLEHKFVWRLVADIAPSYRYSI